MQTPRTVLVAASLGAASLTFAVPILPVLLLHTTQSLAAPTIAICLMAVLSLGSLTLVRSRPQLRPYMWLHTLACAMIYAATPSMPPELQIVAAALGGSSNAAAGSTILATCLTSGVPAARARFMYTLGWMLGVLSGGGILAVMDPAMAMRAAGVVLLPTAALLHAVNRNQNATATRGPANQQARLPNEFRLLLFGMAMISMGGAFRIGPMAAFTLREGRLDATSFAILLNITPATELLIMLALMRTKTSPARAGLLIRVGAVSGVISFATLIHFSPILIVVSQIAFALYVVSATVGLLEAMSIWWPADALQHTSWNFSMETSSTVGGAMLAVLAATTLDPDMVFIYPIVTSSVGLIAIKAALGALNKSHSFKQHLGI